LAFACSPCAGGADVTTNSPAEWVIFRSNLSGKSQVYAVEVKKVDEK
jgi:hypothetical protein